MDYAQTVNRATDAIQGLKSSAMGEADEYQQSFLGAAQAKLTEFETKGRELLSGDMAGVGIPAAGVKVYRWYQGSDDAATAASSAGGASGAGAAADTQVTTAVAGGGVGPQAVDNTVEGFSDAIADTVAAGAGEGIAGALAGAASAIPGLGILAAVGVGIDALVHLFEHKKSPVQQNVNPTTLAAPSQSLVASYSQALPSFDSMKDHASSVAAF